MTLRTYPENNRQEWKQSREVFPIALIVSGANIPDVSRLEERLQGKLIEKAQTLAGLINLCLDAGYFGADSETIIKREGMIPHIRPRNQEKQDKQAGKPPRRWVVERTHSWLNRYRRLLVRWENKQAHYLGFLQIACAITVLAHLFSR